MRGYFGLRDSSNQGSLASGSGERLQHRRRRSARGDRGRTSRLQSVRSHLTSLESLEDRRVLAAIPIISEVLASNDRTINDVDGDDSDFIELFNAGDTDMSLNRYYLTDNPQDLQKWRLPDVQLKAGEYLVVFASNKDRNDPAQQLHANFQLSANGEYVALVSPDGQTVVSDFGTGFPQQLTDISYGVPTGIQQSVLLDRESPGRVRVPTTGALDPTQPDVVAGTWLDPNFNDSSWTAVTTGVGYVPPNVPVVLADSVAEFSGVQGQANWNYGTWTKNFDTDGVYAASEFGEINPDRFFVPATNVWDVGLNGAAPATEITATGGHPAVAAQGFFTHWALRRWTSETEGEITISGTLANAGAAGDGVVGHILVNGTEIFAQTVNGESINYNVTTTVKVGDKIDFAIDAGAAENETGDAATFTAVINGVPIRELPEVLEADSSSDWIRSSVQGEGNDWFYGFYDRKADLDASYSPAKFQPFGAALWTGSRWEGTDNSDLQIRSTSQQAYADANANQWAVRRWVSDFDGTAVVEYDFSMSLTGGTGATGRLYHNGVEVDMTQAAGDDRTTQTRQVTITGVLQGDTIDFATDPLGPNDAANTPNGVDDRVNVDLRISRIADVAESINTDIGAAMRGVGSTAYLRIPFTVNSLGDLDEIKLNVKYDDGFVAYVNGQPVASANAPDVAVFNSVALGKRPAEVATLFESFDLTSRRGLFVQGQNVLQIHLLNSAAGDAEALIQPEIVIGTLTAATDTFRYFGTPTPGGPNGLGAAQVGPQIVQSSHTPHIPNADQAILVSAAVTETFNQLASVELGYRVMYGDTVTVQMRDDGLNGDTTAGDGIYVGSIPANVAAPGEMIRWVVTARDANGLSGRFPTFANPTKDQDYAGTIVNDPSAVSNLKVFHTFIENFRAASGAAGTSGAIFYNGEFYSNVHFSLHGQSSSGFPTVKKSLNVDFPNDHRFLLEDGITRMDDINLLTNFADPSKLRNTLGYEQRAMTGGAYHLAFPIHFRNNAEFFGVYDFVEDAGSEWLDRLGEDPNNSLYKIYNTFTTASGAEKKTRDWEGNDDLAAVIAGIRQGGDESINFIMDNVNLAEMANYLAGFAITSNRDCCHKNYYAYQDTAGTGEWYFLPWDVDLSNGRNWVSGLAYFDELISFNNPLYMGNNNDLVQRLYNNVPGFEEMYLRRLRTLMDAYVKPPGTPRDQLPLETRVDELAALLAEDAALDNAIHANDNVWQSAYPSFEEGVRQLLELYSAPRRDWIYTTQTVADTSNIRDIIPGEPGAVNGRYLVPTNNSLGTQWTAANFDDATWRSGPLGIGFEPAGDNFDELIKTELTDELTGRTSLYVRVPFNVANPATLSGLSLRMKYDDGFVAYINGVEVHREGIRDDDPTFESTSRSRSNSLAAEFQNIDISDHVNSLNPGANMLAIHVVNSSATSNDMFVLPSLVEGRLTEGGGDVPVAQRGNPTIDISAIEFNPNSGNQQEEYIRLTNNNDTSVDISAWTLQGAIQHKFDPGTVLIAGGSMYVTPDAKAFRARAEGPSGGQQLFVQGNYDGLLPNVGGQLQLVAMDGSLVSSSTYVGEVDIVQENLRISEVMFNPLAASAAELARDNSLVSEDFEYIELVNKSTSQTLDLAGVNFSNGLEFNFTGAQISRLAPGERALVVRDLAAFETRYGLPALSRVAGIFANNTALRDTGETLTLMTGDGSLIQDLTYGDATDQGWPLMADGHGSSLQIVNVNGNANEPTNWRASREIGGTPGTAETANATTIVINEVVSRPVAPAVDAIELYNPTNAAISLSNYYLSDSSANLSSFRAFSLGNRAIPAGGYLVLTEADFNAGGGQNPNDFALSSNGDDLYLTRGSATTVTHWVDAVEFGASVTGESFGRTPNGVGRLSPNVSQTLGRQNSSPRVGPIVITEVAYAPPEPSAAALAVYPALDSSDLEFVEVHNPTGTAVTLNNWRLDVGINYDFGAGTPLGAGQTMVVVAFNPANPANASRLAAFRTHYGLGNATTIVGGYGGQLSGTGEGIQLQRPGTPDANDPTTVPRTLEDEVIYDNITPWISADGSSLSRISATAYGNDAASWFVATPTPGQFGGNVPGDFNNDGRVDLQDVERLHAAVRSGDLTADLTGDGAVDRSDLIFLVENVMGSVIGDVTGDRRFDSQDFVRLFQLGGFEDNILGNATYLSGDWNLDGDFGTGDLVFAFQLGGYRSDQAAVAMNRGGGPTLELQTHDQIFAELDDLVAKASESLDSIANDVALKSHKLSAFI